MVKSKVTLDNSPEVSSGQRGFLDMLSQAAGSVDNLLSSMEKSSSQLKGFVQAVDAVSKLTYRIRANEEWASNLMAMPGEGIPNLRPINEQTAILKGMLNLLSQLLEKVSGSGTSVGAININAPSGSSDEVVRALGFKLYDAIQAGRVPALG